VCHRPCPKDQRISAAAAARPDLQAVSGIPAHSGGVSWASVAGAAVSPARDDGTVLLAAAAEAMVATMSPTRLPRASRGSFLNIR